MDGTTGAARAPEGQTVDRRTSAQPSERQIGRVVLCTGSRAVIATSASRLSGANSDFWSIGRLISISTGVSRIVALVFSMHTQDRRWDDDVANSIAVDVELLGEIVDQGDKTIFRPGIGTYPPLGSVAHRIREGDLRAIYERHETGIIEVGRLSQDERIAACVSVEDMLRRHFAVLGTTGVGKSTAVTLLMRKAIEAKPRLRILMLDPHNEFAHAMGDLAVQIDAQSLDLPFWLFRFDEIADVIFRGRTISEELDILRELIPLAKARYRLDNTGAAGAVPRRLADTGNVTVDAPVPYRISDLLKILDDMMGDLEPRHRRSDMRALRTRIESVIQDPRFRFMFGRMMVEDTMERVIGTLFRIPDQGKRVTILQLSGLPSEVLNAVVAVLARLAFDLAVWSGGTHEVLLLCEEAHRYIPLDPNLGFFPTRQAIARIAKEGRKYGSYLGVVTQRPGELDPTILSQCSTVFAMRLGNDRDQEIVRSAIAESSASILSFLSSIGRREAIAFGEAIATPMRMRFSEVPRELLPRSAGDVENAHGESARIVGIREIVARMRQQYGGGAQAQDAEPAAVPDRGAAAVGGGDMWGANPLLKPGGLGGGLRRSELVLDESRGQKEAWSPSRSTHGSNKTAWS